MIKRWAEATCDRCGCAEHFPIGAGRIEQQMRDYGWVISKGKHYCCKVETPKEKSEG